MAKKKKDATTAPSGLAIARNGSSTVRTGASGRPSTSQRHRRRSTSPTRQGSSRGGSESKVVERNGKTARRPSHQSGPDGRRARYGRQWSRPSSLSHTRTSLQTVGHSRGRFRMILNRQQSCSGQRLRPVMSETEQHPRRAHGDLS